MCGRFIVKRSQEMEVLQETLDVQGELVFKDDVAPGSAISIIRQNGSREINTAIWWLMLDRDSLKPNYMYTSFNSRSDKLNDSKSIAYRPFRESRCIIPASAFIEGLGDKKTYYMIEHPDRAIAFGGLYKAHVNQETGELVYSASIITLPPAEQWRYIHPKSIPLMLDYTDTELINRWLDPTFRDVEAFSDFLEPEIRFTQRVTPIDRPGKKNPIDDSFLISPTQSSHESRDTQ